MRRIPPAVLIGGFLVVVVAGIAWTMFAGRGGLESAQNAVTPGTLQAAQERWKSFGPAGPPNYNLDLLFVAGPQNEIHVEVRGGKAVSATNNGVKTVPAQLEHWSVPTQFATILKTQTDIENETRKLGPEGTVDRHFAIFDEQYGYPKQYLWKRVGGKLRHEWTVKKFEIVNE